MILYLVKASLIWCIFLLLFWLLFRKSDKFRLNRMFLLTGIGSGIVLPLIPVAHLETVYSSAATQHMSNALRRIQVAGNPGVAATEQSLSWPLIACFIYAAGAVIFLFINIREILSIAALVAEAGYRQEQNLGFYSTKKSHAPFSFMGRTFIAFPEQYEGRELNYILKHEAAHSGSKHWLDIVMIQPLTVLFWFHPLVWIYRHFLKQEHEYEADAIASEGHTYEYGHFLLRQVLLKGTPALAHSFYFSPIKNRIAMLISNRQTNKWKYLTIIPALLGCGLLIAKPATDTRRVKSANITVFKGNTFYWNEPRPLDTLYTRDPGSGKPGIILAREGQQIVKVNGDAVVPGNLDDFSSKGLTIRDYYSNEFGKRAKSVPDSAEGLEINNLVFSANGRIIYYEAYWLNAGRYTEVSDPYFSGLIDAITVESPGWISGSEDGKPVYVQMGLFILLKPGVTSPYEYKIK